MHKGLNILFCLFIGMGVSAQENAPAAGYSNSFGIVFENDMFNKMDWYFSNGLNFSLNHSVFEGSPLNHILLPVRLVEGNLAIYGLRLRQEIYTPKDLNQDEIQEGDHPYAATLSLTEEKIILRPSAGLRFTSGLRLGVIGPAALGFKAQDFIHNNTPSNPPQGWNNQVGNDLMLNYSLAVDKEIHRDDYSQLVLQGRARLGTVYTDASLGLWSRFEYLPGFFRRVGPDPSRRVNFYVRLGAELRFVGYDASLQGGIFNRTSPYTIPSSSVSRVVGGFNASVVLEIGSHQVSIYQRVVTPRFQASDWHAWMGIGYQYWW